MCKPAKNRRCLFSVLLCVHLIESVHNTQCIAHDKLHNISPAPKTMSLFGGEKIPQMRVLSVCLRFQSINLFVTLSSTFLLGISYFIFQIYSNFVCLRSCADDTILSFPSLHRKKSMTFSVSFFFCFLHG